MDGWMDGMGKLPPRDARLPKRLERLKGRGTAMRVRMANMAPDDVPVAGVDGGADPPTHSRTDAKAHMHKSRTTIRHKEGEESCLSFRCGRRARMK
mmetsp:Transcript_6550/g.15839  ORF Transcript_6550/g.15839 Transcript_6550/m.15839 type:complete len:96 (+) Transcript_6550:330-617(+)